jgi:hypothetical protein
LGYALPQSLPRRKKISLDSALDVLVADVALGCAAVALALVLVRCAAGVRTPAGRLAAGCAVGGSVGTAGSGVGGGGGGGGVTVGSGLSSSSPSSGGCDPVVLVAGGGWLPVVAVAVGFPPDGVVAVGVVPAGVLVTAVIVPVGVLVEVGSAAPTTRTLTLRELALPALATFEITVSLGVVDFTRTWIVTEAGLVSVTVSVQLTVWPLEQSPELELAPSTSRFELRLSLICT